MTHQNVEASIEAVCDGGGTGEELGRLAEKVFVLVDADDGDAAAEPNDHQRVLVPPLDAQRQPLQLVLQKLLLSLFQLKDGSDEKKLQSVTNEQTLRRKFVRRHYGRNDQFNFYFHPF